MEKEFIFQPDQELIDFADQTSRNLTDKKKGKYFSSNKSYSFEAVDCFNDGKKNPARVGRTMQNVQINLDALQTGGWAKADYVFWLILWCFCLVKLNQEGHDHDDIILKADLYTTEWYCQQAGRSKKDFYEYYIKVLRTNPMQFNISRAEAVKKIIEESGTFETPTEL